jgi:hypothetical protein
MKEALSGPDIELWKEAIKKQKTTFKSGGAWKPVSRKMVTEQMKRKLNFNKIQEDDKTRQFHQTQGKSSI